MDDYEYGDEYEDEVDYEDEDNVDAVDANDGKDSISDDIIAEDVLNMAFDTVNSWFIVKIEK